MLRIYRILASAIGLVVVAVGLPGCGQKGTLFLPTEPAAAHRATLPQTLRLSTTPPAAPALAVSSPTAPTAPAE